MFYYILFVFLIMRWTILNFLFVCLFYFSYVFIKARKLKQLWSGNDNSWFLDAGLCVLYWALLRYIKWKIYKAGNYVFFCWLLPPPSALQHIDLSILSLVLPLQPDLASHLLSCVSEQHMCWNGILSHHEYVGGFAS